MVPITDNEVTFAVSGSGKLIGVGNGDPTDQQSDKGTSRKAFSGCCMALVQASKTAGNITVVATAPGLAPARVTIAAIAMTLRPQVAVWERKVPSGSGITGLWRPAPENGSESGMMALLASSNSVYSLRQDGGTLTGTVEGTGISFFGGSDTPTPITDGKVVGDHVEFKAGNSTYSGTVKGDQIELERKIERLFRMPHVEETTGPRPAVGPPPDGSDPSFNPSRRGSPIITVVLRRVQR